MSFNFATASAELETFLKAELPTAWKVQASDLALGQTSAVVLTYTQGDVTTDAAGSELPRGVIGVAFTLWLSTPETDSKKGFPRLTAALPHLFRALDDNSSLLWTGAQRAVTDAGESLYTLPITLISTYSEEE